MKTIPTGLANHLDTGATTLCLCWKFTRTDGKEFGFTDHDRELSFADVVFEASEGLSASDFIAGPGMAVGGHEATGAFSLTGLDENDLRASLWDDAAIHVWLVNWQNADQRVTLAKGNIGEIVSEDGMFRAEIRSLSHRLDQPRGRIFSRHCDADFGDQQCGINASSAAYKGTGSVLETDGRRQVTVSGLDDFGDNWFSRGHLTWTSGANKDVSIEVKSHLKDGSVSVQFWQAAGLEIEPGDTFKVFAGCDKRFETCVEKFSNGSRFHGFPHMPGNDFAMSYPTPEGDNEGEARE